MRQRSVLGSSLLGVAAVVALTTGCLTSTDGHPYGNGGGSGGYGASSSGTGGSTYTPPSCDQTCQDFLVAYGLNDTIWFAWGQNLTGRPTGNQNAVGNCPLGGTVHIVGTNTVSNGVDAPDLTFDFSNCGKSDAVYDLTFTGSVTMQGSFDSDTQFAALTFASSSLAVSGALDYYTKPQISEGCDMNSAQEGTGNAWKLTGTLCGRSFDSETALGPASGGGSNTGSGGSSSGGGSSTGGGTNNCSCFCPDGSDCTGATQPNPCGVDSNGIPNVCGCPVGC